MAQKYTEDNVMCGSHGEAWINDVLYDEITAFKAEINLDFADVPKGHSMAKHRKLIGYEGKGEFTMNKVSSNIPKMIQDQLKKGKVAKLKLISNLDDPDAFGNERIVVYDAVIDKFPLTEWSNRQVQDVKFSFTFTDYDFLEAVIV